MMDEAELEETADQVWRIRGSRTLNERADQLKLRDFYNKQ